MLTSDHSNTIEFKPPPKWNNFQELAPNCPRCASPNTKFCYFNNYSLSQPRYICKACRRYWTIGGSFRNVPVGGGCRKTRRSRAASARQIAPPPRNVGPIDDVSDTAVIDMAAVFARYVNQDGEHEEHSNSSVGASSGSSEIDSQMQDIYQLSTCQDVIGQELVLQDPNAYEGVLYDEVLGLEGTSFQSMGSELEDFEQFSPDDELRIFAENWASFNFSDF